MRWSGLAYSAYERRLLSELEGGELPRHVGIILDGNRRWARTVGESDVSAGHRRGAEKIEDLLSWCSDVGVELVTLWLLSTDNLARPQAELDPLLRIIERAVTSLAEPGKQWRLHIVGALDTLPARTAAALKRAEATTQGRTGLEVNCAVGYGGRREVVDAVRALLVAEAEAGTTLGDLAERLDSADISRHLYTSGQRDPDLVIRTSGEQRLSGFLLWQSAHSEFWFCEAPWPEFRRVDFLRALRDYARRHRRYGA